jgi:predicted RND superfamily exporter protein
LFTWSLLSESLLDLLRRDVTRVLLPMTAILLLLLAAAFRRTREVALSVASLGFSLLALSAAMVLLGWSWNLMNVMALPLLFGAGVDYSIHIQLALRRHGGDVRRVLDSVGRAILLCGTSTVAGFSSLGLASNAGLASLGRVAALGVALTALTCVFLLPTWWHAGQGLDRERP